MQITEDPQNWQAVYQELSRLIGVKNTKLVFNNFRGSTVTFPLRLETRSALIAAVTQDQLAGYTIMQLARKYGLSQRTILRYLQNK